MRTWDCSGAIANPVARGTNFADQGVATAYLAKNPNAKELARTPADACPRCNIIIQDVGAGAWTENHVQLVTQNGTMADASGVKPANTVGRFAASFWDGVTSWWQT